jgi:UDP-2,3-diacylglucosamine pyrophosphatase LpxH
MKNHKHLIYILFILLNISCSRGKNIKEKKKNISTENVKFNFIQITDTHLGDLDHYVRTSKIVKIINILPQDIKFVVHTGDIFMDKIVDDKIVEKGMSILKKIKYPLHFVPGNHDIRKNNLGETIKIYKGKIGKINYVVKYKGVNFIFIYTEPLRKNFNIDGYSPFLWLKKTLISLKNEPSIIFHHSPSVREFYFNKFHVTWKKEIREKWVNLVTNYNVKAVITGHFHTDEFHWLNNKVPLYVSSSVAGYWKRQGTFRIFKYNNGKLSYRTQYIRMDK